MCLAMDPFRLLLISLAGWLNQRQQDVIDSEERLHFHQEHSQPVMEKLHAWFLAQFAEKKVEPNSGLGEAISYCLNRWERLTLFLHQAAAPLDSNIVERALSCSIRPRTAPKWGIST